MCLDLDKDTVDRVEKCQPPNNFMPGEISFDAVVELFERREFRREYFIKECLRLGTLLAERMEDAEGWNDISRIDPAKAALTG